ncbi:MAG: OmpA family protein [Kofleriaceae bacterium]
MRTARSSWVSSVALAASAVLFASLLTGCPDKKPKDPTCSADTDCKDGTVCVDKACVECRDDSQCDAGQTCKASVCVAKPECERDDDCADGKVCQAGACRACSADADCGPGGTCDAGACRRATKCSVDEDCADDEDCVDGYCQRPWEGAGGAPACQLATVYFAFDDSSIQPSERDRLTASSACLEKSPDKGVTLDGHTDASGTDEYNIALSERRAQAVADYLARLGVDPARMQVVPKGETAPTGMGDDKDRRVEFQWR